MLVRDAPALTSSAATLLTACIRCPPRQSCSLWTVRRRAPAPLGAQSQASWALALLVFQLAAQRNLGDDGGSYRIG